MTEPLCVSRIGLHCLHCPNTQSCKNFKETLALPSRIVSVDFLQLLKPFLLLCCRKCQEDYCLKKWSKEVERKFKRKDGSFTRRQTRQKKKITSWSLSSKKFLGRARSLRKYSINLTKFKNYAVKTLPKKGQ